MANESCRDHGIPQCANGNVFARNDLLNNAAWRPTPNRPTKRSAALATNAGYTRKVRVKAKWINKAKTWGGRQSAQVRRTSIRMTSGSGSGSKSIKLQMLSQGNLPWQERRSKEALLPLQLPPTLPDTRCRNQGGWLGRGPKTNQPTCGKMAIRSKGCSQTLRLWNTFASFFSRPTDGRTG